MKKLVSIHGLRTSRAHDRATTSSGREGRAATSESASATLPPACNAARKRKCSGWIEKVVGE